MTLAPWFSQQFNTLPALMPALLAASLATTALGFVRVVYLLSVGYAFSIVAISIVAVVVLRAHLDLLVAVQIRASRDAAEG